MIKYNQNVLLLWAQEWAETLKTENIVHFTVIQEPLWLSDHTLFANCCSASLLVKRPKCCLLAEEEWEGSRDSLSHLSVRAFTSTSTKIHCTSKHPWLLWLAGVSIWEANLFWREGYHSNVFQRKVPEKLRGYIHGLFTQKTRVLLFSMRHDRPRWQSSLKPTQFKQAFSCPHLLLLLWSG